MERREAVDVATAAIELITGPLLAEPRRLGKALTEELTGIHSARLGSDRRVLYEVEEAKRVVVVLDIRYRSNAYRRR